MSIIRHQCRHCHAQWKSSDEDIKPYCKHCDTIEKREKMDKENIKNFEEQGLKYNPGSNCLRKPNNINKNQLKTLAFYY